MRTFGMALTSRDRPTISSNRPAGIGKGRVIKPAMMRRKAITILKVLRINTIPPTMSGAEFESNWVRLRKIIDMVDCLDCNSVMI